jgi:hypothetical protein
MVEGVRTGNRLEGPTPTVDFPKSDPASGDPSGRSGLPISSSPDRPARGWFFVPLPPERLAIARGAAIVGLICTLPLFLFIGGVPLLIALLKRPMDVGGLICLGPGGGLCLAGVVHFFAARRGFRLSVLGLLVIPVLFFGLIFVVNSVSLDWEMRSIKQRIAEAHEGEPEFASDLELKAGFLAVLDELHKDAKPKLYFRCVEKHDPAPPPEAKASLEVWKLDPDFAEYRRLNMEIPGSNPSYIDLRGSHIESRLRSALESVVPKSRMEIAHLSADDSTANKVVLDIAATTRNEGTFTKFSSSLGRPSLLANIRIEWQVRLLDRNGASLYSRAWTTRPASELSFRELPLTAEWAPYKLLQLSAHDNFTRELLGRLGLTPGPVKAE